MTGEQARALIVVDVQRDFCDDQDGATMGVEFGGEVAGLIGDHLRRSIDDYALVVLTSDWHVDPGAHFSETPDFVDTWPHHCVANTDGAAWHPALETALTESAGKVPTVVIRKGQFAAAYSGFEGATESDGQSLDGVLRGAGVSAVDVVGIATDYCVAATVADSLKLGYQTQVLAGLTAAVNAAGGAERLAELAAAGATVVGAAHRSA